MSANEGVREVEVLEEKEPSRKVQILGGLLVSLITVLLFLGILELVGHLWERNTAQDNLGWTLVASRRMPLERFGAGDAPYYLFEPNKDYNWEGIPVQINSRGFRGEEFEVPKAEDTFRILNVGDSVVFGWEVAYADSYGQRLEAMLNAQNDGREYEVINAGVPGWNVEMARDFLLQEGLSYEPDLVLLDLTLVNDVYGQGPAVSENPDLFDWMRDHTHAWPFLTTQARFLLARQVGPEAIPVLNPPKQAAAYFPVEADSPVWDRFWDSILAMHEVTEDAGIPLLVVAFPTAYQVNSASHPDTPQRVLAQRAAEAGITFIDLLPMHRQLCAEAAADACEGYENLLFADVWMHPNALGHQLAADAIFAAMP